MNGQHFHIVVIGIFYMITHSHTETDAHTQLWKSVASRAIKVYNKYMETLF